MSIHVNADNFVRAETHRMFRDIQASAGGIGAFRHNRTPASIDEQTVIRLNRDTLYSFAIVDLAEPARLTLPDADGRYFSAMIVNEDHFVNRIFMKPVNILLPAISTDLAMSLLVFEYWSTPRTPQMWPLSRRFRTASR